MSLLDSMAVESPDAYTLTEDYRIFVESMTGWLRTQSQDRVVSIIPETGYLYRFDLTSFLLDNKVPLEDHWLVMRVNGLTTPQEFDETVTALIVPAQELITRLKQAYRTKLTASG